MEELTKMNRRDVLGNLIGFGTLGTIATLFGSCVALKSFRGSIEDIEDNYELLKGNLRVNRSERGRKDGFGNFHTDAVTLEFIFNKKGNYHCEGWTVNYRDKDSIGLQFDSEVKSEEVPKKIFWLVKTYLNRLEISGSIDGKLYTDRIRLPHYGQGPAFNSAGAPMKP